MKFNYITSKDLVTEDEIRENLEPEIVKQIIDHQRHFHTQEGSRFWPLDELEDLRGVIEAEAEKEVQS